MVMTTDNTRALIDTKLGKPKGKRKSKAKRVPQKLRYSNPGKPHRNPRPLSNRGG